MCTNSLLVMLALVAGTASGAALGSDASSLPGDAGGLVRLDLPEVGVTLIYPPGLGHALAETHPDARELEQSGVIVRRALRGELLGRGQGEVVVDCDSGGSHDPQCTILQVTDDGLTPLGTLPGLRFTFSGDGTVHVAGHVNTMFDVRRRYEWTPAGLSEAQQPFLYVGLETTTNAAFPVYRDAAFTQELFRVMPGQAVTVLINDHAEGYLVATSDGVVGWAKIPVGLQDSSPIDGLYYAGD